MGAITVTKVGKAYRQYPHRWARLAEWVLPGKKPRHELKWALQDISFQINPGESVGLIGLNGAGKSTLLKMIVGTTQPTTGSIQITGRIAALLELGMGFHPDFTGRQNAFMAGQLLGYESHEIAARMADIESFAEIGDYIDMPVRVYSSGMQVRLAFSVATAIRPDILVVDEALAVGDAYFQHKCFERIRQFRAQGTTLLLVSHDTQAIQSICDRALLLNQGTLQMEGKPEAVMDYYNALLASHQKQQINRQYLPSGQLQTISGTGEAQLSHIELQDEEGRPIQVLEVGQTVRLVLDVQVHQPLDCLIFGYGIKDRLGQVMYGTNTHHTRQPVAVPEAPCRVRYIVQFQVNLGPGSYSIQTSLSSSETHLSHNYEWRDLAMIFEVMNIGQPLFAGVAWLPQKIEAILNREEPHRRLGRHPL